MTGEAVRPKVFGLGLSKTGTTTLGACFERLGYDHFSWNQDFAKRVLRGDVNHALDVAHRHDSFDDLPWPALYRQLDAAFPDAKFVLTVRADADTWFRSMIRHAEYKGRTEVRERFYGSSIPHGNRQGHVRTYLEHNRNVRRHFANRPGKLLVLCWEHDPGWKPLCDFLGHPSPGGPVPHRNSRREAGINTLMRRVAYTVGGTASNLF